MHPVPPARSVRDVVLAGAVHAYTAFGAVIGLLIVLAAIEGEVVRALWLFLLALFIDGTDGTLARRFEVKRHLPWFDGARLDDIVDYLTYAFAPMVLLLRNGYLPEGVAGQAVAALPLLASAYQFCRADAKTEDHLFLGFPSYWNVVAFYAVVLSLGPITTATLLVVFSVLAFVPIGYVYPSRTTRLQTLTVVLTGAWLVSYAVLLLQYPDPHPAWIAVSLGYLGYYLGLSGYLTAARRRRAAPAAEPPSAEAPRV